MPVKIKKTTDPDLNFITNIIDDGEFTDDSFDLYAKQRPDLLSEIYQAFADHFKDGHMPGWLEDLGHEMINSEEVKEMKADLAWQKAFEGCSKMVMALKDYAKLKGETESHVFADFTQAYDEDGNRQTVPPGLIIAMMAEWYGVSNANQDPQASRQSKQFSIELSEELGREELQNLFHAVTRATKLQA